MEKTTLQTKAFAWLLVILLAAAFIGLSLMLGNLELKPLLLLLATWWALFAAMWLGATKWRFCYAYIRRVLRHQREVGSSSISVKLIVLVALLTSIVMVAYFYGGSYTRVMLHGSYYAMIADGAFTVLIFACAKVVSCHPRTQGVDAAMEQSIQLTTI